jgi:hypothetical protein
MENELEPRRGLIGVLAAWAPALVWMGVLFWLSSLPGLKTGFAPSLDWALRKLAHSLVYALLMVLVTFSFSRTTYLAREKLLIASFCLVVLYAASDEVHQRFIPQRHGAVRDVGFDAFGAAVAWLVISKRLSWFVKGG